MPGKDPSRPYKQIGETLLLVQQVMVSYLHSQPVDSVCFSPDGTLLASAASGDCVRLWNVAERKPVSMLEGRTGAATPSQVSFSADSKLLAASVGGGIVQLWTSDGKTLAELPGHDPGPTEAVFSTKGGLLLSGDLAGRVRLWDVTKREVLFSFIAAPHRQVEDPMGQKSGVDYLTCTPDGIRWAFESRDKQGLIQVWDIQYPESSAAWVGSLLDPNQTIIALSFSPDGLILAAAGAAGTVWIWELSSRQIVGSFAAHPEGPDYRKNAQEWALGDMDWSSDGRYLVTCGQDPYTVKLWEVQIRV